MTVLWDLVIYFAVFIGLFGIVPLLGLVIYAVLRLIPKTREWMERVG